MPSLTEPNAWIFHYEVSTPKNVKWTENTKRIAQITGDGALLFLTSVKEASDVFPPLKTAAAGILILADLISVGPSVYLQRVVLGLSGDSVEF